jgi:hypothetical protein
MLARVVVTSTAKNLFCLNKSISGRRAGGILFGIGQLPHSATTSTDRRILENAGDGI